jgi:hypothetical protein
MFFKSFMKFAALAMVLVLASGCATLMGEKHHNLVFHVTDNDPAKWNQILNNINNVQQALGKENVTIEVVANGAGLNMLKFDSEVANRMTDAVKNGVTLAACGTTMKALKVSKSDLHTGVTIVPAGIVEVMSKQEAGWAYVKP